MRSFVRGFRNEILSRWRTLARALPAARDLDGNALVDHIPELLDEIAVIAEELGADALKDSAFETARRHALDRLGEGFDIGMVVREMSLLRSAIHAVWHERSVAGLDELTALDMAIDRAIAVSVARYAEAHQRTLAGIDRISTASFDASSVNDLLQRLLMVFIETTPAVDTAAILLREGDRLYLRAAVGFDEELERGASVAIGEDFAAGRAPLQPGVPLLHHGELIGMAHMGSTTVRELSEEDRQHFASMAARATLGIAHHVLRQELARSEERFKKIAAERERALAKLESLLAASPIGIAFVDRELRYLRLNDALAALDGRPVAEHLGRTVAEVMPEAASHLEPVLRGVLATGAPALNMEYDRVDPVTKRRTSLLATFFPVRAGDEVTGVGGIVIDVTETKRAQEALREEQTRIQSIIEHAPAAIWVKDHAGHLVLANHRLTDTLGHVDAVIGRRTDELLPAPFAGEHAAHDDIVMRENRAIEVEEVLPSPDGPRTFLAIKFPIPGNPPLVGGIATEITQRKHMEQELRTAVRAREEVLAIVSHDLRNPLGTIQLATTMLMSHFAADTGARRPLESIHRSCTRMENLIEDLLDTANIRAGRLRLDLRRQPASEIVAEGVELQRPMAEEKNLVLELRPGGRSAEILADRERLLQVFGNLIGNAIKFCRPGDSIVVGETYADEHVVFSVKDSGPGIGADVTPYLFDAYWSADLKRHGSGLGLYISRGIVEGHGGRIWVESEPGHGAKFLFSIPLAT